MNTTETILRRLKESLDKHAHSSLRRSSGTEFEFGQSCGIFQGLSTAIQVVEETLDGSEDKTTTFEKNLRGLR